MITQPKSSSYIMLVRGEFGIFVLYRRLSVFEGNVSFLTQNSVYILSIIICIILTSKFIYCKCRIILFNMHAYICKCRINLFNIHTYMANWLYPKTIRHDKVNLTWTRIWKHLRIINSIDSIMKLLASNPSHVGTSK